MQEFCKKLSIHISFTTNRHIRLQLLWYNVVTSREGKPETERKEMKRINEEMLNFEGTGFSVNTLIRIALAYAENNYEELIKRSKEKNDEAETEHNSKMKEAFKTIRLSLKD